MTIHQLTQGSDEWAAFRLMHHGASEAAAMLGLSKKTTRSELLRIKHTGMPKEFSDWVQKNILDCGHEVEAMARPIIENLIGEDLYPVTCSNEDEGGILSASCDGLTMGYDTAFEHKQWSAELAASVAAGILPALGFAMLGKILISPKVAPYFLLGFLLAAYLNVPVLGIALLGVIIVALMLVNDQNKPNNTAVVDGGADDDF